MHIEYRSLGRTGVKVSPICLGAVNFADPIPEDEAVRIINRALDAGSTSLTLQIAIQTVRGICPLYFGTTTLQSVGPAHRE